MERAVYERMAADESEHWWFVGRRAVLEWLICNHIRPPKGARILEAGCGTGGNLAMLAAFGKLDAFEYDAAARATAQAKGIAQIKLGALPDGIDEPDATYDLIALFDVLEHIEDDRASLATLGTKLAPRGRVLLTVPAMPWLWSHHDELHHHYRRYTKSSLRSVITAAGLRAERIGYFNTLLFPLAVAQRGLHSLTGSHAPMDAIPVTWVNALLGAVFKTERLLIGRASMPFGLSLFAIVSGDG